MDSFFDEYPRKLFIRDLKSISSKPVWVNGKIEQIDNTDSLIINDGTGKVKISKCDSANIHYDKSWMSIGSQCCVIGLLRTTNDVSEIIARKLTNIPNDEESMESWRLEVQELNLFLKGKIKPDISTTN